MIAGRAAGPLAVALKLPLEGATSVELAAELIEPIGDSRLVVRVSGLSVPAVGTGVSAPAPDIEIDHRMLSAGAATQLAVLLRLLLQTAAATATGGARCVVEHLPGVLGLVDGLPPLPFERLVRDADALRGWVSALCASEQRALGAWLRHLGGLAGLTPITAQTDPLSCRLPLIAADPAHGAPELAVTTALVSSGAGPSLLRVELEWSGLAGGRRVEGHAVLTELPLRSSDAAARRI